MSSVNICYASKINDKQPNIFVQILSSHIMVKRSPIKKLELYLLKVFGNLETWIITEYG